VGKSGSRFAFIPLSNHNSILKSGISGHRIGRYDSEIFYLYVILTIFTGPRRPDGRRGESAL
jgi:hypothetical protein